MSGAVAGMGLSWYMLTPFKLRATIFGGCLGAGMGALGAWSTLAAGYPLWDMTHDFEGYMFGRRVNLRDDEGGVPTAPAAVNGFEENGSSSSKGGSSSNSSSIPSSVGASSGSSISSGSSSSSVVDSGSKGLAFSRIGGGSGVESGVTGGEGSTSSGGDGLPPLKPTAAPWSAMFKWLNRG